MYPTLEEWGALRLDQQQHLMRRVQAALPHGFSFRGICNYELGDQRHSIAEFEYRRSEFVFIPGGDVRIGYDENRDWSPTVDEQESWGGTAIEYGIEHSIFEYIKNATIRPRTVPLKPILMETSAQEIGWTSASLDAPDVVEVLRDFETYPELGGTEHVSDVRIRVTRDKERGFVAQRSQVLRHADIVNGWKKEGMRLPTTEEWEYACGSGARSLFRWGDHVPCDRYPTDRDAAPSWDLHRRPNAFGLSIAFDPYQFELVDEPNMTRGGDGGATICGGAGFFVGWLTLATSYFETHTCERNPQEPIQPGFTFARRVLSLD